MSYWMEEKKCWKAMVFALSPDETDDRMAALEVAGNAYDACTAVEDWMANQPRDYDLSAQLVGLEGKRVPVAVGFVGDQCVAVPVCSEEEDERMGRIYGR